MVKVFKVILVMFMGKVVFNKKYEYYEYIIVVLISVGVSLFLFISGDVIRYKGSVIIVFGVFLLIGYMVFDSFIFNW